MSQRLFGRQYQCIIGEPDKDGLSFTELECRFKVETTGDSAPNKAEIELFNLTEDHKKFISKKDIAVIFKAGYGTNIGQIFAGYTTFTNSVKGGSRKDDVIRQGFEHSKHDDANWITKISAQDGLKAMKKYVTLSLANDNLTETAVMREVVKNVGLSARVSYGTLKALKETKIFHGAVITSFFKDFMDNYAHNHGLQWHIWGEVLYLYPIGKTISDEIIQLDESSGLIGSPEPTEKGYKFTSLLRHDIKIGTLLYVEAELIKEQFMVANVTHTGDLEGTEYYSVCECIPI